MGLPEAVVIPADTISRAAKSAAQWLPQTDNPQFVKGAIAAYAWVLGRLPTGPVSGAEGPVTLEAIRREERLADDAIYDQVGDPVIDQRFAVGAQNALLWLRGAEADPPISIGD